MDQRQKKKPAPTSPISGRSSAPAKHVALATFDFDQMDGLAVSAPKLQIVCHGVRPKSLIGFMPAYWAHHVSVLCAQFITFLHCNQGFSLTFLALSVNIP